MWSGGKNLTTKRRMVFLGPGGGKKTSYGCEGRDGTREAEAEKMM